MILRTIPKLIPVLQAEDIPEKMRNTPFETLLRCHNLGEELEMGDDHAPDILLSMCMDHRKRIEVPEKFAYIVRTGGGNIRHNEFNLAYAIGIGQIRYVALIGHTDCGMMGLPARKDQFVDGMVDGAGWSHAYAEMFFHQVSPNFEIGDPVFFMANEALRLKSAYPKIYFQPFLFSLEDNKLYAIEE